MVNWLFEFEVGAVKAAVIQLDHQLTTRASPRRIRLPNVRVLNGSRIVTQTAVASSQRLFEVYEGSSRIASNQTGTMITWDDRKDIQSLVSAEAELQRNCSARIYCVHHQQTANR